jgi:hypothetical protein
MTEIEITFDPKYEAACAGLAMYGDHEIMPDGDWIRFARRVTGIPELFVYFHRRTGNFVLAKWLFKPDVCLELETFPIAPDRGGWMSAEELKARCKPVDDTVRAVKDKMRQASSERKSAMDDDATQRAEAVKMLRRKGNEREAYKIENGMTPWVGARKGGESYARTCETLRQMAKAN